MDSFVSNCFRCIPTFRLSLKVAKSDRISTLAIELKQSCLQRAATSLQPYSVFSKSSVGQLVGFKTFASFNVSVQGNRSAILSNRHMVELTSETGKICKVSIIQSSIIAQFCCFCCLFLLL